MHKVPFSPFRIHLADGRKLDVPHPEFVWLPKAGVFFYYHTDRGAGERINPLLIVSVESEDGAEVQ
ncbi:MAG: hypothetical protein ABR589_00485 [Chthoniobacterales bacterium]